MVNLTGDAQQEVIGPLCEFTLSFSNNILYTDDTFNATQSTVNECFCKLTKKVEATITFSSDKFLCPVNDSWRIEFYSYGCLEAYFSCSDATPSQTQSFEVQPNSPIREVNIKMAKVTPDATEAYYDLRITAVAVQAGTHVKISNS